MGLPPFLLLFAAMEVPGLSDQAGEFGASLRKVGTPVEVKGMDGTNHRDILFNLNKPGDVVARTLLTFVEQVTSPRAEVERPLPGPMVDRVGR
jgi:acetyl esterase/lipase